MRAKWVSVAGWWEAKCEMETRLQEVYSGVLWGSTTLGGNWDEGGLGRGESIRAAGL